MATDLSSIRTMQDVINVLSIIFFNMNEIERIYYDMFINPEEMYVTFQRYDDQGVLETITLPNRAMLSNENLLTGEGNPNGITSATPGSFYLDTVDNELYYKSSGSNTFGWSKFWSSTNFQAGINYLAVDGDASQLTNLNMSNAGSGFLQVARGGTGVTSITGLVKGNGTSAFSAAVDGVDYLGPNSMPGLVAYYPVDNIPSGWLRCDGSAYSRTTYARLFGRIGTTYGAGDGSTTFNVPDLYNYFIRGWDGVSAFNTVQNDQVGGHIHTYSGNTSNESAHTHSSGSMAISGSAQFPISRRGVATGAFSFSNWYKPYPSQASSLAASSYRGDSDTDGNYNSRILNLNANASGGFSGETSPGTAHNHTFSGTTSNNNPDAETRVKNKMLIPVIKF